MIRLTRASFFALAVAALVCTVAGCGREPSESLRARVPGLDRETADALVATSDAELANRSSQRSSSRLLWLASLLPQGLDTTSVESYRRSANDVGPALTRVRDLLGTRFGFDQTATENRAFFALPDSQAVRYLRLFRRANGILPGQGGLSRPEKVAELRGVIATLESARAPLNTASLWLSIGELLAGTQDRVAERAALERALRTARAGGDYRIVCQALGVLGELDRQSHDREGMDTRWGEVIRVASAHGITEQIVRIESFYANLYANEGRLSAARHLFRQTERLYSDLGGEFVAIRFLLKSLDFQANLGCWQVVESGLRRALVLQREHEAIVGKRDAMVYGLRVERLQARLSMARGETDQAVQIFRRLALESGRLVYPSEQGEIFYFWGHGLVENHRPRAALPIVERGFEYATEHHFRRLVVQFALLRARARADLGHWSQCREMIAEFDRRVDDVAEPLLAERTCRDALMVRATLNEFEAGRGETSALGSVFEVARSALLTLQKRMRTIDASEEGLLFLSEAEPLRDAIHAIIGDDPRLGYEFETVWRGFSRDLGTAASPPSSPTPLQGWIETLRLALAEDERPAASAVVRGQIGPIPPHSIHVLFRCTGEQVERWVVDGAGHVDRVKLPISTAELRVRIADVLKDVRAPFRDEAVASFLPERTIEALRGLASILLPAELIDESVAQAGVRTLFLTPDRCVASLPFGLLNLSTEGYLPLIERFDPIYLSGRPTQHLLERYEQSIVDGGSLPALIVANPALDARLASVFGEIVELDHGVTEAKAVERLRPGSLLLTDEAATKERVLANWDRTRLVYIVAHVLRDPEVSYLAAIPLGSTSTQPAEDLYLDVTAIRRSSFDLHPLVVLSGCASGASYIEDEAVAPGLGQAFLDAGASAVIQTFWDVRDDVASTLMQNTMRAWMRDGLRPDQALNAARRGFASSQGERSHPFFWASYSIQLSTDLE